MNPHLQQMLDEAEKDPLEEKIKMDKKLRIFFLCVWVPIKIAIAYFLIESYDFGIYIVIGYILFELESISGLNHINRNEIQLMFNNLERKRIENLQDNSNI